MSELINKLKDMIAKIEIIKGGPGSGPREGQRNRAGTGNNPQQSIDPNNALDNFGPSIKENNNNTTIFAINDQLSDIGLENYVGSLKRDGIQKINYNTFKNDMINFITNTIANKTDSNVKTFALTRTKIHSRITADKNINDKITAAYLTPIISNFKTK